ncbi:uncharacterized protein TRIVIDRAFT_222736 [Trichoderma virens Gv29-8]|uniref:Uncharacterized protein n=1 Tax=Hypocrea virens (strain Gv29-8 / FGSC 10586) TaxID=413071 RepID=G9MUV0_HYPVG|nr:uncharacterized protein TRIVIDRAFT_222736 [Trichoderma virens Gv29-8]EHK21765.1 hypothetical protein TRIVIDRAFT_222736 [Trichoderma virens Gv29-8]UKZ51028.1 hypothetical protein TrVGV298_004783 [Trichoderma virens]
MMVIPPLGLLSALSPFVGSALSFSSYSDATMRQWLNASGQQLAAQVGPMWFFSQALGHPQCYPTSALTGSAGTTQVSASGRCARPNTECGCRTAGVGIKNWGPDFPVYNSH